MRDARRDAPDEAHAGANDTGNSLSRRYYGNHGGALTILSSIGLRNWQRARKIVEAKRYEVGDTIVIPELPRASINPPQRSNAGMKETRT